jgi:hypothetical protein
MTDLAGTVSQQASNVFLQNVGALICSTIVHQYELTIWAGVDTLAALYLREECMQHCCVVLGLHSIVFFAAN